MSHEQAGRPFRVLLPAEAGLDIAGCTQDMQQMAEEVQAGRMGREGRCRSLGTMKAGERERRPVGQWWVAWAMQSCLHRLLASSSGDQTT